MFPSDAFCSWQIATLRGRMAAEESVRDLKNLLAECEDIYPGIDLWLDRKAIPGIRDGSRCGFVVYEGEKPVAAALVKLVEDLKLCSLRVLPGYEERGLGTALFHGAARVIAEIGEQFHFTAPERLVVEKASFFESLGFKTMGETSLYYRPGESEWQYVARAADVLAHTQSRATPGLFDVQFRSDVVFLSLYPKHARSILRGTKTIELRKGSYSMGPGSTLLIYAAAPDQCVMGTAVVRSVRRMPIAELVESVLPKAGCTEAEIRKYAGDHSSLCAIEVGEVREFAAPMDRRAAERRLGITLSAPQAPRRLSATDPWMLALGQYWESSQTT